MSNEASQNKNNETAQKLAAALDQSTSFDNLAAQLAQNPEVKAAAKNVVKISDQAALSQEAANKAVKNVVKAAEQNVEKQVEANKAATKSVEKMARKQVKVNKAAAKAVTKPAKKAVKKIAKKAIKTQTQQAKKATQIVNKATQTAIKNNAFAKIAPTSDITKQFADFAQQASEQAQRAYSQSAETAKQLLAAKSANQVFEIQSKAARQRLEQNLNQALQINKAIAETISKAFAALSFKK